jgi:5,10-methylenetetrahydromethanopterin reductase
VTRHPTVTANAICTLDELSGGRAFLGIGAGDDSVKTINMTPSTLEELSEQVGVIKKLAAGGSIEREPITWRLATARNEAPPVYWAAAGPRSFRYGGRAADGVIDTGWLVPSMLEEAVDCITEGATSGGKSPSEVARVFNSGFSVDNNRSAALSAARTYVAKGLMYRRSANVPGWSEEKRQHLLAAYNYQQHLAQDQPAIDLVPEEMITRKAVAGTPSEAVTLLGMVLRAGYTHVALLPLGDVEESIRRLGEEVVPQLR